MKEKRGKGWRLLLKYWCEDGSYGVENNFLEKKVLSQKPLSIVKYILTTFLCIDSKVSFLS